MKNSNEILEILKSIKAKLNDEVELPLSTEEAAAYLKIPVDTLYKKTHTKQISFFKAGKRNYFTKESLNAYVFKNRISSLDEDDQEVANAINLRG